MMIGGVLACESGLGGLDGVVLEICGASLGSVIEL